MVKKLIFLLAATIPWIVLIAVTQKIDYSPPHKALIGTYAEKMEPSVDHSKFAVLQVDFKRPQDVTKACLTCHNQAHEEVMVSSHWNWEREEYIKGKGIVKVGKKNILNNFCIGTQSNEQSCAKCHIGYGYNDKDFDFKDSSNIDCLSCHDNSNTYVKGNGLAGLPDPSVDLKLVASKVGRPTRDTCGSCHFFGGGGNNVKHGDLEAALSDPHRDLDVHMASEASNMQCVDCHSADNHQMKGKVFSIASSNMDRVECSSCHGEIPHQDTMLNEHMAKVACQTCHIPAYALENPTKMEWDWSTAGKLKDGKPYEEKDELGKESYLSIKGSFRWAKNLEPDYVWFNGTASHYLLGDKIDPTKTTVMNQLHGSYHDPDAKITPVKIHRSKQPYDLEFLTLIQPKTFAQNTGEGGYWKDFDWHLASIKGMAEVGLPSSGKVGFAETIMYWPINHMVAPKEKSVSCAECHTRDDGRLAAVEGFYLPGRDFDPQLDSIFLLLLQATGVGILGHAGLRVWSAQKNKKGGHRG